MASNEQRAKEAKEAFEAKKAALAGLPMPGAGSRPRAGTVEKLTGEVSPASTGSKEEAELTDEKLKNAIAAEETARHQEKLETAEYERLKQIHEEKATKVKEAEAKLAELKKELSNA